MSRVRLCCLQIAGVALAILAGCRASPWSGGEVSSSVAAARASLPTVAASPTPQSPAPGRPAAGEMQDVMAEVRRLGANDPALQSLLLAELQASDPTLWPLVVESFRSRVAYGRQLRQNEALAAQTVEPSGALARDGSSVQTPLPQTPPEAAGNQPRVARLPVTDQSILLPAWPTPTSAPPQSVPSNPAADPGKPTATQVVPATPPPGSSQTAGPVLPTSYDAPPDDDWRSPLDRAICLLDAQLKNHPPTGPSAADHARLRLLQVAAGQGLPTATPLPATDPCLSRFWTSELAALDAMLRAGEPGPAGPPSDAPPAAPGAPGVPPLRAEARRPLADAAASLADAAPLEVRNLAFCRAVQSFGSIERFDHCEFAPGQRVLLYAEIENFRSEPTPRGYHTSLRSTYEIVDATGRPVAPPESATTEDYCLSPRRDYFIGCDFRLANSLRPGAHTLRLRVDDLKTRKSAVASVDFTIK